MSFDEGTILFLLMATCLLVGLMLFVAWLTNRQRAYLWWAAGFIVSAVGLSLTAIELPDIFAAGIGTLLLLLGLGLCWAGARSFDNRPIHAWPVAVGLFAWAAIYMLPAVYESQQARTAILSVLVAMYSFAIAYEFWRGRSEPLASRLPLVILCAANGGVHVVHGLLTVVLPGEGGFLSGDLWFAVAMLQPALIMVAGGLYGIGLSRDRTERTLRQQASFDSLTNVYNRGAFLERAQELLTEVRRDKGQVAILLFDLDRFKAINDNLGHTVGDKVLSVFAGAANAALRGTDLFGRIGGEEFAAMLPRLDEPGARMVAERVRSQFAAAVAALDGPPIEATVSIGVVSLPALAANLDKLLVLADRALYEAKRAGRDQVKSALALVS